MSTNDTLKVQDILVSTRSPVRLCVLLVSWDFLQGKYHEKRAFPFIRRPEGASSSVFGWRLDSVVMVVIAMVGPTEIAM